MVQVSRDRREIRQGTLISRRASNVTYHLARIELKLRLLVVTTRHSGFGVRNGAFTPRECRHHYHHYLHYLCTGTVQDYR